MIDLAQAIQQANHVTFLTGAGVSTASGIPDYRSKGGLYAGMQRPEEALSHDNLVSHPDAFYAWVKANMYHLEAQPNVIHQKMAAITNQKGSIVTQNVDGLDREAGAKHVVEFHGSLKRVVCQRCGQTVPATTYLVSDVHQGCGGRLRPQVVLYGEGIDPAVFEAAIDAVAAADLIVVVGTSFQVYPFAGLIAYAKLSARLVAVNREAISLPAGAQLVLGDAVKVFESL